MAGPPSSTRASSAAQLARDNKSPLVEVPHWHISTPNGLNWSKTFPYQLLVLRKQGGGHEAGHSAGYVADDRWSFTLPLGLQDLQIQAPFAHSLQLTQDGAVEQRGGLRVRQVRASGTTGVLPLRPTVEKRPFTAAQALFAGTLSRALGGVGPAATSLARDLGAAPAFPSVLTAQELAPGTDVAKTSGYYQFRLLQAFLERYAEAARQDANRDLRLALACWKDEAVYLLSPQELTVQRRQTRPRHYDFSFAARAFARVSLDRQVAAVEAPLPLAQDPGAVARALQTIRDTRRTLAASRELLAAVSVDLADAVATPLREVSLLLQEAGASTSTLADFPTAIVRACKQPVLELLSARDSAASVPTRLLGSVAATSGAVDELRRLGSLLGKADSRAGTAPAPAQLQSDPANAVFNDPGAHLTLFSAIRPGDLRLPVPVVSAMAAERARVAALQRSDFVQRRATVQLAAESLAESVGLGSEVAARVAGRVLRTPTRRSTDGDLELLFALNSAAQVLDSLAVRAPGLPGPQQAAMDFVGGLARAAGLPFAQVRSKRAVPFPFGVSLEALAAQYLGDPDRWHEVATLNQLRSPFVDEAGTSTALVVGGSGGQVLLPYADAADLRLGQVVSLASRAVPPLRTVVVRLVQAGSLLVVTLSDPAGAYRPADGAVLHRYLADTVNSRMLLWIPSDEDPDDQVDELVSPADLDPLLRAAGADWLLDTSSGLVVTPDGDFPLARGLALVVQSVRLALSTPRGSLLRHPSFGLPAAVGESLATVTAAALSAAVRELFAGDPLFRGVEGVAVRQDGPTTSIGVSVAVRGMDRPVPVAVVLAQ